MFRSKYLDYAELFTQLQAWATQNPGFVRLTTIGKTAEGRDVALLTIGKDPDRSRPAVWVDGNMHASEVCGSSVALAIAEDLINLHKGQATEGAKTLPAHMAETLKDMLVYVLPRIAPDGAEEVLKLGRYLRSSPVDTRKNQGHAHWEAADIDGDGMAGYMRQQCADGELVELRDGKTVVMVPRGPEDAGPFYRLYPEGRIANFDGRRIPDPYYLSDNQYDFNRNFAYQWAAEPEQAGAGDFPGSAPETRAILEFATAHPNIFAWLNLHTFGGVLIRPLGDKPDDKMDQSDLAIFRQVEAWMTEHTGYASVSGFHEFLFQPDKPLHGDLSDYAYHQRGALAYVVELWDLFHQLGIPRKKPFFDHYTHMERKDYLALAKWDAKSNKGRVFKAWRKVKHPQLGEVEVGGFDPRVGIWNPSFELLGEVCTTQSAAFLRVATLVPRVTVEVVKKRRTGEHTRVELRIANTGYLGTYGLSSAKSLPHSEVLRLTAKCTGTKLVAPSESIVEIGHLDGWGRGLYTGVNAFAPWTRGNVNEKFVTLVAQGSGKIALTVGSCRVGFQYVEIAIS